MIIAYPYRYGRYDGMELRYSIRSMVKHFRGLTDIVVIGDRPTWYDGNYIEASDIPNRKELSILTKLSRIPGTFLMCNDDHFALKDFDETLPNYYSGTCGDHKPRSPVYRGMYKRTPPEWLHFDVHFPMFMTNEGVKRAIDYMKSVDYPMKSTYGHLMGLQGELTIDCKIRNGVIDLGGSFLSTDDVWLTTYVRQLLDKLYPEKSPYEY